MKKVYFVTHGVSQDYSDNVYERPESPLTDYGYQQSVSLAQNFSKRLFDVIISSPLERAIETAEEIAKLSKNKVEIDELFTEVKLPKELEGKNPHDPQIKRIQKLLLEKWSYPAWHYSDEENFIDVKKRAINALLSLSKRQEKDIVVVTHSHFLTMVFLVMALGKCVTAEEYYRFNTFSQMDHASISICELTDKGWKMQVWNDNFYLRTQIN